MAVDSRGPAEETTGSPSGPVTWPVRSGRVPPLADGFIARPETATGLGAALVPGTTVVLVPGQAVAEGSRDWRGSCGKTQLAVGFAESMWQSRRVELLVWVVATGGAAGRVLLTATSSAALSSGHQVRAHPVGAFSPRESLSYLMGRLTADTDQRLGAIDLVEDLRCEPLALAQASAVIAGSALSCRDYRGYFAQRREQLAKAAGDEPAAGAVTWTFSFEQAARLAPGSGAQSVLALAVLP